MLRKEIDEMALLKGQVQELAREVEILKSEIKLKNKSETRGFSSANTINNKKKFNYLVGAVANAMGKTDIIPRSFASGD